jgi:putative transposase
MNQISYQYCHFPPAIVQRAVWLYIRYSLNLRDVEEILADRGIEASYETIRRWVACFGPPIACRLRRSRQRAHSQWHLDEMFTSFGGKRMYLWQAIDQDGEVLDILVQAKRDTKAACRFQCRAAQEGEPHSCGLGCPTPETWVL